MAHALRQHVKNSIRKRYHKRGMDFSRVHASGTSTILSKGQTVSANNLERVLFTNKWKFLQGGVTRYLDATCLVYKGKKLIHTVDYRHTRAQDGAIHYSGDMMLDDGGTHTIHLNLARLNSEITSCVFVISAWAGATLADILSPSIMFTNQAAEEGALPLCTYDLSSHDKISYLTSVVMCRLYRTTTDDWHVQAIGDSHKGAADNYGPIYEAVEKLL